MKSHHDRTSAAQSFGFGAAVFLVIAGILYPLSLKGGVWLTARGLMPLWAWPAVSRAYQPLIWVENHGPQPVQTAFFWYVQLFQPQLPSLDAQRAGAFVPESGE